MFIHHKVIVSPITTNLFGKTIAEDGKYNRAIRVLSADNPFTFNEKQLALELHLVAGIPALHFAWKITEKHYGRPSTNSL